jgi:hypothetical protein
MNRSDFFDRMWQYEQAELFLTDEPDGMGIELYRNIGRLEPFPGMEREISGNVLKDFFIRMRMNRKTQLIKSPFNVNLQFQLWMNEDEGVLRFSFMTAARGETFDCEVVEASEIELIEKFLRPEALLERIKLTNDLSGIVHEPGRLRMHVYREVIHKDKQTK